jgi:Ca2+-binding EF-hand superfamily protein
LDGNGFISREELQEAVEKIMSFDSVSSSDSMTKRKKSGKKKHGEMKSGDGERGGVDEPDGRSSRVSCSSGGPDAADDDSDGFTKDVETLLNEADEDGNGLIDFEEFVRVLVERRT